jgi:Asp-tRNA(Asn)/Glu-tRNA(Gln) amidotransferase A subunit family amidase
MAASLDTVGLLARAVTDVRSLLAVLRGRPDDPTSNQTARSRSTASTR